MIQIQIEDSFGNQLQLGDLVLVRYTNPLIFFMGVLAFKRSDVSFCIASNPKEPSPWEDIKIGCSYRTYEKVADRKEWPVHYYKTLGRKDYHEKHLTARDKKNLFKETIYPLILNFQNYE